MASENELTTSSFLEMAIQALTLNDASQLKDLLQIASTVKAPARQDMLQAISRGRLFRAVLSETACNLRLLQRLCGRPVLELRAGYALIQEITRERGGEQHQWPH